MKTILIIQLIIVALFSFTLVSAVGVQDSSGMYHDEVMATGGQDGSATGGQDGAGAEQRQMLMEGEYMNAEGRQMMFSKQENNMFKFQVGDAVADSSMELEQEQNQEQTRLYAKLSNGGNAEIKIMPDVARDMAMQRLSLKNCDEGCTIELKEVAEGNQIKAAYEVKAQKNAKIFGLFGVKMQVQSQVDAENGNVLQAKKPWWAFLASEE